MKKLYMSIAIILVLLSLVMLYACEGTDSGNGSENPPPPAPALPDVLTDWQIGDVHDNITLRGAGTPISNVEDLKKITASGTYYLTDHINLGRTTEWTPLHSSTAPFTGTLHGNGYIIYNLNINTTDNYQGLFAALNGATISNLGIGVGSIKANAVVGALAGYVAGTAELTNIAVGPMSTSEGIVASGTLALPLPDTLPGSFVGGVVGMLESGELTLAFNEGLSVKATGTSSNHGVVGGMVGENRGTVTGSSSGTVSSSGGTVIGGLVGRNAGGRVVGSVSGTVSTDTGGGIGGLVGSNIDNGTVIGTASGTVSTNATPSAQIGGLIGVLIEGTVTGVFTGIVKTTHRGAKYGGGVIGMVEGGEGKGYATGWVMVSTEVESDSFGPTIGVVNTTNATLSLYYNDDGGDHVGSTPTEATVEVNQDKTGATGKIGTNGIGTGITGISEATAANMSELTEGTAVGEWTFTSGRWPKINLPAGIIDYVDYSSTPEEPADFSD